MWNLYVFPFMPCMLTLRRRHITSSGDTSLVLLLHSREPSPPSSRSSILNTPLNSRAVPAPSSYPPSNASNNTIVTTTTATKITSHSHINSNSSLLPEHEVCSFMEQMEDELHNISDLAKELERTLQARDPLSTRSEHSSKSSIESPGMLAGGADPRHHYLSNGSRNRKGAQETDSKQKDEPDHVQNKHGSMHRWYRHKHSIGTIIIWPDFLAPFFSYYTTFFLLPTMLSHLIHVGILTSRRHIRLPGGTTSALSFFAFKFAVTWFLGQSAGFRHLLGTSYVETGALWTGCEYIADIFRYVPQSLGLATAGVGTILALAESIISSRRVIVTKTFYFIFEC
ncbi:hypothetical protein BC939DRAFT_509319 [Gamsiella multidivaricata]|uniref:uncharacterized protein n=1 Tax=Gamsiella multidivaricata TaxID=101098 RepID=UPI0022207024|nr:uncharacterized protein BC939DRAFT_509319 [Gamsiella multidivaricata]KAI7832825.1 hypothetical protein BC939DRAFT_509319 [Gamsiella multidivaricata]